MATVTIFAPKNEEWLAYEAQSWHETNHLNALDLLNKRDHQLEAHYMLISK